MFLSRTCISSSSAFLVRTSAASGFSASSCGNVGRRGAKRYILNTYEVASLVLKGQAGVAADVLDLSLSGAYLLLASENIPKVGEQLTVGFSGFSLDVSPAVEATVMYLDSTSFFGKELYGIGVQFVQRFPVSVVEPTVGNEIYFARKRLLVNC